ncbi:MAG: FIST C-terminal domain-containing protein [Gammaproteobacteria bacterium]|nr:FIST C-terminal domain-containing protein [Gammaproteobacteria bacterium]
MRTSAVATGLSYGPGYVRHVEAAVSEALEKAALDHANAVLLFLTPEFASEPAAALRAAARVAGCTQVVGCTGAGLFTEQDWVLDSPAAAAMVFGGNVTLEPPLRYEENQTVVSLTTPAAVTVDWLDLPVRRIGAVSTDLAGHGPFLVWRGSRVCAEERTDVIVRGTQNSIVVAQGVRALTSPLEVADVAGLDIRRLGNYPALNVLFRSLPATLRRMDQIPLHLVMCGITFGDPNTAIQDGRFRLDYIVSANQQDRSITVSNPLPRGARLFWALRDKLAAERAMAESITSARKQLGVEPDFALMFPCISRGPSFYGNRDRDIDQLIARFPELPLIGFYGNGEIAPLSHGCHLFQYSTALGLFAIADGPERRGTNS